MLYFCFIYVSAQHVVFIQGQCFGHCLHTKIKVVILVLSRQNAVRPRAVKWRVGSMTATSSACGPSHCLYFPFHRMSCLSVMHPDVSAYGKQQAIPDLSPANHTVYYMDPR